MCMQGSGLCFGCMAAMYNVLAILSMADTVCLTCMQKNVQCTCYTEHGRYGLSYLYAEAVHGVHEQCMLGRYGMYGVWCMVCSSYVAKFYYY